MSSSSAAGAAGAAAPAKDSKDTKNEKVSALVHYSTTVYESIVLDLTAGDAWTTVENLDFAWLPTVTTCVYDNKCSPADVGGTRTVTYKDGTVQKFKLTERSDARRELSWDLIDSTPAIGAMSVSWTLKLTPVNKPKGRVFIEWTADFSRDASNAVLLDGKFKAKENFIHIRAATKARLVANPAHKAAVPALKRQLSTKSQLLRQAFEKMDKNGNGKLEFEEFSVVVNTLFGSPLPEAALRVILLEADLDRDGTISFDEFCAFVGQNSSTATADATALAAAPAAAPAAKK